MFLVCFWGPVIPHKLFGSLRVKGFSGLCILIFYLFLVDWLLSSCFYEMNPACAKTQKSTSIDLQKSMFFLEKQKSAKHRGHMKLFLIQRRSFSCPEKRSGRCKPWAKRITLFSKRKGKNAGATHFTPRCRSNIDV